jgi:protein arginine kinase
MSVDLSLIPDGGMGWLDASGQHSDIVLSTRIRLARNVEGYAFTGRARDGERLRVLSQVREAVGTLKSLQDGVLFRVDELSPTDRSLLHERHLVSKELAGLDAQHPLRTGAAVILSDGLGVMVNEEDHLRLQALRSGFALQDAFVAIDRLDRDLGARVPYSFHQEFGFLTACPTNVGTGMRASVLIHLPGLVLTKEIGRVLAGLQQMGLTYRGLYGEGSEVVGNYFQISNQTTLGRSEEELLELLVRVVGHVIEREEEARRVLLRDAGYIIEDKLWRAYGTLRYARSLTFDEAMNYLSGVRLAVGLKLITGLSVYTLNKLLIFSQAAHLAHAEGRGLTESETSLARARYVRKALEEEAGSIG